MVLAAYVYAAGRYCYASRLGHSGDEAKVTRALALTPDNAELHEWLGLYHFYLGDSERGTTELRAANALQPQSSRIWLDLAMAYHFHGRFNDQKHALDQALSADPTTPRVLWEVANFYLAAGDTEKSYPLFRRIIADDEARSDAAIDLLWRSSHDVKKLLDGGTVPPRVDAYLKLLDSITYPQVAPADAAQNLLAADVVWDHLTALQQPFKASRGFAYLDLLLRAGRAERASVVWQQMAEVDPAVKSHLAGGGELINNGDFDEDPLQGGFDWRFMTTDAVRVSLDNAMARTGLRALRLDFAGPGSAALSLPCVQFVAVEPNTHYHFSGFIRSRDLLTTSGPRFAVSDAQSGAILYQSSDILGTDGWREESGDFTTGPDARLLMVGLIRQPSEPRIEGTLWIDDLSLKKQP